jgi:hypothetical protein
MYHTGTNARISLFHQTICRAMRHILNAACKIKAVKCIALQEQQTDLGKSLENTEQRPQQGRDLK